MCTLNLCASITKQRVSSAELTLSTKRVRRSVLYSGSLSVHTTWQERLPSCFVQTRLCQLLSLVAAPLSTPPPSTVQVLRLNEVECVSCLHMLCLSLLLNTLYLYQYTAHTMQLLGGSGGIQYIWWVDRVSRHNQIAHKNRKEGGLRVQNLLIRNFHLYLWLELVEKGRNPMESREKTSILQDSLSNKWQFDTKGRGWGVEWNQGIIMRIEQYCQKTWQLRIWLKSWW